MELFKIVEENDSVSLRKIESDEWLDIEITKEKLQDGVFLSGEEAVDSYIVQKTYEIEENENEIRTFQELNKIIRNNIKILQTRYFPEKYSPLWVSTFPQEEKKI